MTKVLVTGAFGLVGSELIIALQKKHGEANVIALDLQSPPQWYRGHAEKGDVTDEQEIKNLVEKHGITEIYHLAALISAMGEKNPNLAWKVNLGGLKIILDCAINKNIKIFWPSSIAVFGPTTPTENTPQHTVCEPVTMYGLTKYAGELLCQYYHSKYGLDVRSLRYPGLIGFKAKPGDGTTEYAVWIFHYALKERKYTCFLKAETVLPMMYMEDAICATLGIMEAKKEAITLRTSYNLSGISFSPREIAEEIKKNIPEFRMEYSPDSRQKIAEGWPKRIDDSIARKDWGWKHTYDLQRMVRAMLAGIKNAQ